MQNKINRVLSLLLVVVMVLSMIPAALAAESSDSVAYAAENTTTGAQYADLNEAIATAQAGQIVRVLADAENVVYHNAGVIVDLNGCDLTNVTVAEGVTLTAIDSATDDYEGDYGSVTTDGNVAATVKTAEPKSYVAIYDNGSYSFHRYYASIAAISLQPSKVSLGYRAEFRGDEVVKNAVVSYGYELWANDNAHKTYSRTDALEKTSMTLRLSNILREGNDALNAMGSTATIGGNAFITLDLGNEQVTLYGTQQETTLRQVVEAVNATASQYGEAQLASVREMITTYSAWMMGWATENIFGSGNDTEGDGLKVEIVVDVNAENNILSENATMTYGDISATVPQGAVLENGVKQLVLTITEKAKSDSDVTEGEGETLIPLDVHISGISADNTAPIVICLGDILPKGLNIGNYDLFHVENGQTVSMTRVYTVAELDAHNEFYYDPATGSVTVAMASFSEIALRSNDENPWKGSVDTSWYDESESEYEICNADQLAGLGKLVDGGNTFDDMTITMIADIDLYGTTTATEDGEEVVIRRSFNPIGYGYSFSGGQVFKGTFDGNGNTISNLYQNGWDLEAKNDGEDYTYSTAGGGLFASVEDATIKNLTMDGANIVMECVDMGTVVGYANGNCTFQNIIVKNSTVQNYNRYTGGVIGEVGGGGTYTLNNVDVEKTTTLSALWGTFDPSVGGIIGGVWHTAGNNYTDGRGTTPEVTMTNCDVACKLDVYNDVTSAYQWYSYRRCGMLIGYTEESKTVNGRTEATATFLETENCTVTYGKWANYHYCEFNNTTSMGARYPWVRVEAGLSNGAYSNARYGVPTFDGATLDVTNHTEEDGCHGDNDQHNILVAFHQLYGGGQGCYGGNTHVEENLGVIEQSAPDTAYKFKAKVDSGSFIQTGSDVKLGDLFEATGNGQEIQNLDVYAFVSPVNATDSVRATMNYNNNDWTERTLTFSGTGLAKITISDYYYCKPRTLIVNVGAGVVYFWDHDSVSSMDCPTSGITLPAADNISETTEFVGWVETEPLGKTDDISNKEIFKAGDTYYSTNKTTALYAVYSYSDSSAAAYTLVKDVNDLAVGDSVIIVASASNVAMSTTQNGNNRGQASITKNGDTITVGNDVQILTVAAGTADGTYAFYTGENGYLYAAGGTGKNNYLRTKTTLDTTGSWNITITDAGVATIKTADSSVARHTIMHNTSSSIFSCYASGQADVSIYKLTGAAGGEGTYYQSVIVDKCAHSNTTTTSAAATCQLEGYKIEFCNDCRTVVSEEIYSVLAHEYINGTCASCGDVKPIEAAWKLVTDASSLKAGDKIVIASNSKGEVIADIPAGEDYLGQISAVFSEEKSEIQNLTNGALILTLGSSEGAWTLSNEAGQKLGATAVKKLAWDKGTTTWTISITDGDATISNTNSNYGRFLHNVNSTRFTTYTSNTSISMLMPQLYKWTVNCDHEGEYTTEIVAPTCTEAGYSYKVCKACGEEYDITEGEAATGHTYTEEITTPADCETAGVKTFTCSACNDSYTEAIEATGHNYADGTCGTCGKADPDYNAGGSAEVINATYSIAGTAGSVSGSNAAQTFTLALDVFTFTNVKAESSTAIRTSDSNHYRIYAKSTVSVVGNNGQKITKISFTTTGSDYTTALKASLTNPDYTVSVSGNVVTVTFADAVDTIDFTASAQIRINEIEISYYEN